MLSKSLQPGFGATTLYNDPSFSPKERKNGRKEE